MVREIIVPQNISLSRNAKKNIKTIETNANYNSIINSINEKLEFISQHPTNIFLGQQRNYVMEKLGKRNGYVYYSIRVAPGKGDRITYGVDADGNIKLEGLLGHYDGTDFKCFINNEDDIENKLNASINQNVPELINGLLNSNDYSTQNIGEFLQIIYNSYPNLYNNAIEIVYPDIDQTGEIRYVGPPMDFYKLRSSIIVLNNILSKEITYEVGQRLLQHILTGVDDHNYEFYAYYSFLMTYTSNPDQKYLRMMLDALSTCYERPNTRDEALDNMRKLVILVECHGLHFEKTTNGSCYNPITQTIYIDDAFNSDDVLLHEFGHAIDLTFTTRDTATRPNKMFEQAKNNILNHPDSAAVIKKFNNQIEEMRVIAKGMFNNAMIKKYGSIPAAISAFEEKVIKKVNQGQLEELLEEYGINKTIKNRLLEEYDNGTLNTAEVADNLYIAELENYAYKSIYAKVDGALLDIISAIFGSCIINVDGEEIDLATGHSSYYFQSDPDNSMTEIMADLNSIIVSGRTELLNILRAFIGDECMDFLMSERNRGRIITTEIVNEKERRVV